MRRTGNRAGAFVGAVVLLAAAHASAAPILEAEVSPERVAPGDHAIYTLTLTDAEGGDLSLPRFGALRVVNQGSSMQSVFSFSGGVQGVKTSRVYTFTLEAPQEGEFAIGPAVLRFKGRTYESNTVKLHVDASASAPRPARPSRRPQAFDPFEDADPFDAFGSNPWKASRDDGDIFLRANVDRPELFLGEQATLSLYLFSQADVGGVQTLSFPKLDGFWAEDIESPTQLMPEIRNINGMPYRSYMLRRRALFPLRAGELVVDAVETQVNLGITLFFGARGETVKRRSSPVKVTVKPLPAEGQPPGFDPANVGSWSLSAQASPQSVSLGQPVQLRVTLEGTGNIKGVRLPKLQLPEELKTYDPTTSEKVRIQGHRYGGTRVVEWVVMPERTGEFELPGIELPYFDPAAAEYRVARTQPMQLSVSAGSGAAAPPSVGAASAPPAAANVLTGGARPVRMQTDLTARAASPVWARAWFWPVVAAPPALWLVLALGGAIAGALRRRDPVRMREKRARGVASKRLAEARAHLEAGRTAEFYAETSRALVQFVTDRWGVPALGLTHDALGAELRRRGHPDADVGALVAALQACEAARFAPPGVSAGRMEAVLEQAQRVVAHLDSSPAGRAA